MIHGFNRATIVSVMYKGEQRSRRTCSRAAQPRTAWRTARTRLRQGAQTFDCARATIQVNSPKKQTPAPAYNVHSRAPATSIEHCVGGDAGRMRLRGAAHPAHRGQNGRCSEQHAQKVRHVVRLGELRQRLDEIQELLVVRVVEPGRDRQGVLGLENVGRGRIVNDETVSQFAAES